MQLGEGRGGTMEQRNYIVFIALMFAIFGLFWYVLPHFFPTYFSGPSEYTQTNTPTSGTTAPGQTTANTSAANTTAGQPAVPAAPAATAFKPRAAALAESPRIEIHTDRLLGTISLIGG